MFEQLAQDIKHGYGTEVHVRIIDTHSSKSQRLPIVTAEHGDWNTSVAWYAYNYHNYYAAFRFRRSLPMTLLYPISGLFGPKHMSGHESGCPLPDVTNFQKAYWNRDRYEGFACFAGSWHMATTLRYLEAVSKIDVQRALGAVLDESHYGAMDNIHGNWAKWDELSAALDLGNLGTYEREVAVPANRVVKAIRLDWFGVATGVGPCCVEIEAMPGALLPASTATGSMFVDPRCTSLANYLGEDVQPMWSEDTKYVDRLLTFMPVDLFKYRVPSVEDYREKQEHFAHTPYRVCGAYNVASLTTRLFRFAVPNVLDAALLAKWWLVAGIPCAEEALAEQSKEQS